MLCPKVDLIRGDMVSMIEGATTTTTITDPTVSSLVPETESEILNSTPASSMALKEVDTTKMSFKKKLLLRKALSKAAGGSESSSESSAIDNSAVDVDSSSSDDTPIAADDMDSETYNKSNQPKAFRQSTGHSPSLTYLIISPPTQLIH